MQTDLEAAYPGLKINIIGVNQFDQGSQNDLMTSGRALPWLQDVDANGDGQSDAWTAWQAVWRDVVIVDGDNRRVSVYNVTSNNLATQANYNTLRDMIVSAAYADQIPYCNWRDPLDANHDATIDRQDVQCLFDTLNTDGGRLLAKPASGATPTFYYDVNQDGYAAPLDLLLVINYLNEHGGLNSAPLALADQFTTAEDQILTVAAGQGVLANDSDTDLDSLTALIQTQPAHGKLTFNTNGSFTYTPNANYFGSDSFQYVANDSHTNSAVATVTITVTSVDDAPTAIGDAYAVPYGVALTTTSANGVLQNDSDLEGDPLTATVVTGPTHGSLILNTNGTFTYTPAVGFSGTDSFVYSANDGLGKKTNATVTLDVQAANTFQVAANAAVGTVVGQVVPTTTVGATRVYEFADAAPNTDLQLLADDHMSGDKSAPVVLIEYLDIQCPPCGTYHPIVRQLESQFEGELLVVRRNLPLTSIHPNAFAAAVAAEAANRQGAYDAFINLAYANQSSWSSLSSSAASAAFESFATQLNLNLTQFRADVADPTTTARVQRDVDNANRLGVNATPTFYLNGQKLTAPPASVSGFGALIQTAINQTTAVFELDRSTGQLKVLKSSALNPTTQPAFDYSVRIRDTSGVSQTVAVHITVVSE